MRTQAKIVALLGAAANTEAFFTQFFHSEETPMATTTRSTKNFGEVLYSGQDFVENNWYYGTYYPIGSSESNYGYFAGPFGGDAFGFYSYDYEGFYWSYNGVYAFGV